MKYILPTFLLFLISFTTNAENYYAISNGIYEIEKEEQQEYSSLFDEYLNVSSNAVYIYGASIQDVIFKEPSYMQVKSPVLTVFIKLKEEKIVKGIRFYKDYTSSERKQPRLVGVFTQPTHEGTAIPSTGWTQQESVEIPILEEDQYLDLYFENPTIKTNSFYFYFTGSSERSYQGLQYMSFLY